MALPPAPQGVPAGYTQQVIKNGVGYFQNPSSGLLWNPLTQAHLPASKTAAPAATLPATNAFTAAAIADGPAGSSSSPSGSPTSSSSGSGGILGSGVGPNVGPDLNPVDAINNALSNIWTSIKDQAAYAGLATVVVLGGFALLALGLLHATHNPQGAAQ